MLKVVDDLSDADTCEAIDLFKGAFPSNWTHHSKVLTSYPRRSASRPEGARSLTFRAEGVLVGFLNFSERTHVGKFSGRHITIGSVCIAPFFRGRRGFERMLTFLNDFCLDHQIDYMRLQGIPFFYHKYGFRQFSPKVKVSFVDDVPNISYPNILLSEVAFSDISKLHSLYNTVRKDFSLQGDRSISLWECLLESAGCHLFPKPLVIRSAENGDFLGYVVATDLDPISSRVQITEFFVADPQSYLPVAIGVCNSLSIKPNMVDFLGPCALLLGRSAQYHERLQICIYSSPSGGNVIRPVSTSHMFRMERFILQADGSLLGVYPGDLVLQGDNF